MNEIDNLTRWMDANGYTIRSLADELGIRYNSLYLNLHRDKVKGEISAHFKVRFARRFGWVEYDKLFDKNKSKVLA